MTCQNYKDLMMGYLDNELTDDQIKTFEEHISVCPECKSEFEEFKKLKDITDNITLTEPEDKIWQQYWSNVYNRVERSVGWIICSVAAIILLIYGGFKMIEQIIKDPSIEIILKIALLGLITGTAIMFVSVLRERLYVRKKDRYKDVRR